MSKITVDVKLTIDKKVAPIMLCCAGYGDKERSDCEFVKDLLSILEAYGVTYDIMPPRKKAVLFDSLFACCPYSLPDYRCSHKENTEDGDKEQNCCCCYCPLGIEAEQEDMDNPTVSIDWDGMCADGEVSEGECLLVACGSNATEEDNAIIKLVEREEHKWDEEFLKDNPYPDYNFEQNTKI